MAHLCFPDPVRTAADFFNREKELAEVQRALRSAGRHAIVILGPRKIGKSSLLNVLVEWGEHELNLAAVHVPRVNSAADFAAEVVEALCYQAGVPVQEVGLVGEGGRFRFTTVTGLTHTLNLVARRAPVTGFLVCVDKFDDMLRICTEQEMRSILNLMWYIIEKSWVPLRFIVTMTQIPEVIWKSYESELLLASTVVELTPWDARRTQHFVEWLVGDRWRFEDGAHEWLFRHTEGHPFALKRVLKALLTREQELRSRETVTVEDLKESINIPRRTATGERNLPRMPKRASTEKQPDAVLLVDAAQQRVFLGDEEVDLSPFEYRLLVCLARRQGKVVGKETVAREVWPEEAYAKGFGDTRIDALIARVRKRIGDDARHPRFIETRRGIGYILHNFKYVPSASEAEDTS